MDEEIVMNNLNTEMGNVAVPNDVGNTEISNASQERHINPLLEKPDMVREENIDGDQLGKNVEEELESVLENNDIEQETNEINLEEDEVVQEEQKLENREHKQEEGEKKQEEQEQEQEEPEQDQEEQEEPEQEQEEPEQEQEEQEQEEQEQEQEEPEQEQGISGGMVSDVDREPDNNIDNANSMGENELDEEEINKNRNILIALLVLIIKLLKNLTKIIPPVSKFFENVENGMLGNDAKKMLNSAQNDIEKANSEMEVDKGKEQNEVQRDEEEQNKDDERENIEKEDIEQQQDQEITTDDKEKALENKEWVLRGMEYVESRFNDKDSFMRENYLAQRSELFEYAQSNNLGSKEMMEHCEKTVQEKNIPRLKSPAIVQRSYLAYNTVSKFLDDAEKNGIDIMQDGKPREFEEIYGDVLVKEAERMGLETKDNDGNQKQFDEISEQLNERNDNISRSNEVAKQWRDKQNSETSERNTNVVENDKDR